MRYITGSSENENDDASGMCGDADKEKSKTPEEKSASKNEKRHPGQVPARKRISKVSKVTNMFGIKKLAFQFSRAVGNVDSKALPQQVQARCQDCEGYRAAIAETCDAMMQIMQGSPDHRPAVNSAQQLEYPPGTAPSEIFEKSLEKVKGYWYDEVLMAECSKACKLMAAKQRELQDRGRRQIHVIRTFINNVYFEFHLLQFKQRLLRDMWLSVLQENRFVSSNQSRMLDGKLSHHSLQFAAVDLRRYGFTRFHESVMDDVRDGPPR
ncbi:hypothetical protein Y032_0494g2446 [Ancylostoma ceylanicum]|uniref:BAR domain-containing protein n=1 Tax=Ancylostoma ceylanicum TaxID=53326 RepID=A0A016WWK2_9BILA|nr:hypothetical protein Y032_0494g2446 [Ancylostoma ceylanicum]